MLPLHYLAQWGPSEAGVLDMVLVSTGSKARERDGDGNTAEVLAMNAEYENCREVVVVAKIREFRMRRSSGQKGGHAASAARACPCRPGSATSTRPSTT